MGNQLEVLTAEPVVSEIARLEDAGPATGVEGALAEVLAEVVGVERVSVESHFFDDLGADSMVMAQFCARVRKRDGLPSVSMKDIYQHPTIRSLATAFPGVTPAPVEGGFAEVLAEVVGVERVSVESHFFDDLGADSMVMAQFCARVRKRDGLPSVSMKDIYRYPSIRSLAAALSGSTPAAGGSTATATAPVEVATPVPTAQYLLCGALQVLFYLGYSYAVAVVAVRGFEFVSAATGVLDIYLRSALFAGGTFLAMCLLPILAKWLLVGRWKAQRIRIWSPAYVRFWLVKTLVRANPLVMFVGSPLYVLYLRALGARIGRGAVIFSKHFPLCTDLLTVGPDTVIRKDTFFSCYRARSGVIETGPVTLGRGVFVGEWVVLDIDTSMGDGSQIGHASALHAGQAVPAFENWHGSPAERTGADYREVPARRVRTWRRVSYSLVQLLTLLVVYLPLGIGGVTIVFFEVPRLATLLGPGPLALTTWLLYVEALAASLVLFLGSLLLGLLVIGTVPRVVNLVLTPEKTYRLYGFHFWAHRYVERATNSRFYTNLFGDSSYIVGYLRWLGYDLAPVVQTGSNFATGVKHDSPYLCSVGSGTVVADGLSMLNVGVSSTSFRVSRVSIGRENFLGNLIAYPARGRTGENVLLGTKVLVPIDGKVRENVGLLGSPSFEIPRSVDRDSRFDHLRVGDEFRRRLAAKNRHNAATIGLRLLVSWVLFFGITVIALAATDLYALLGEWSIVLATNAILLVTIGYQVVVERASTRFRGVRPTYCSIYERDFWRVERFYKMHATAGALLDGTPFKCLFWRSLGVRVGKRLYDDGADLSEKNLVTFGDDVALNEGAVVQCHSQEDYAFKSDRIVIGSGCTVGVNALVHYGVTMGDGAVLAPDSFLMKGEEVPPYAEWGGNPAHEIRAGRPVAPAPAVPPLLEPPARPTRSAPPLWLAAALVPLGVASGLTVVTSWSALNAPPAQSARQPLAAPVPPPVAPPVAPPTPAPAASPVPDAAAAASTAAPAAEATASFGLADIASLEAGLAVGDSGPPVVTVQQHLQRLGHHQGDAHGSFDEPTVAAVRAFQAAAGVVEDPPGTVGRSTAQALEAAGDRPELAAGSRGEEVHRLQHALLVALGRSLPRNGSYGSATVEAVRDYQSSRGLQVDGAVGPGTWAALQRGR
ncbi:Pls/PosA family non-ribosomal peptide synthetase [Pseudonocardia kunmingensis]|uniref:Non-ribosomal peptide synthetase-like protein n=1 Tax=Pseudonocardia kunmingensis TaxID=630975 RepID=A0A543DZM8_9PSEU|nr:Pls/PosA family non-ribosomal peptide synthetase [Pseudonocardia kunmingensis]TQM14752.1 non-ribosomal peptide synthetase-like protein [Pseudonocardia kunmingensis]